MEQEQVRNTLLPDGFKDATAEVNGITMHYVIGGTGDPLILIHGSPQTWYCWHKVMPELSEKYTVIAVDLRGVGESSKPEASAGYDSGTMAKDIHELVIQLGLKNIRIIGHDIGLLVAYAYAANYGVEVERLVLLDGLLAGIEPMWSNFIASSQSWVFSFPQVPLLPEQLTAGKELEYLSWFFKNIGYKEDVISEFEINEYVRAYSSPGAMSANFEWFRAFDKDVDLNKVSSKNKLKVPVLALGGEKTMGPIMVDMVKEVATNVQGGIIPECGHWIAEEKPHYLLTQLSKFLP